MITKEHFLQLVSLAESYIKGYDHLVDSKVLDLNALDAIILETSGRILEELWRAYFTDEGVDWINWYLYEKRPGLEAYDETGAVIPTENSEDLWNIVKSYNI